MTDPLTDFLLARFADDETRVRPMLSEAWPEEVVVQIGDEDREPCVAVGPQEAPKAYLRVWRPGIEHQVEYGWNAYGVQVYGPSVAARVLAECDAKRRIVELHSPFRVTTANDGLDWNYSGCEACHAPDGWAPADGDWYPCLTLRLLALPYADHPGYLEEWRP